MCAEHELTFVYDKQDDDVAWLHDARRFFEDGNLLVKYWHLKTYA
jgi:hypothetical protein